MKAADEKEQEVILESYSTQIDELLKKMTFQYAPADSFGHPADFYSDSLPVVNL